MSSKVIATVLGSLTLDLLSKSTTITLSNFSLASNLMQVLQKTSLYLAISLSFIVVRKA